ncbi:hypothetical protein LTR84_000081 [Exophiala bonariae]|uniref:Rhodanese domain-containing protein n=1 Tax=Exophiala bonariae TaxID=1690606 RepID=A0AAV9NTL7_9EURO|nr:hypothetical protein LTR84_000081 [Exophiala bonariae]
MATPPPPPPATPPILLPAPALSSSRYNRQLLVPQLRGLTGQSNLLKARILIVGLGGLGSPAALYLAGAGIWTLGLMDGDAVETSNLHRQIAHNEDAAARRMSKVASALRACRALNSDVEYLPYEMRAMAQGPDGFLDVLRQGRFGVVLDCTDNPAARYLISDACVLAGAVLVSGAAQRGEGQLVVLNCPPIGGVWGGDESQGEAEEKGPCYRCVFPRPPAPEMVRGCSEIGILGHVVGVIGVLMAGEAIKIVSQGRHVPPSAEERQVQQQQRQQQKEHMEPKKQQHTMLLYNTFAADPRNQFRTITLRGRRKDCVACGDDEVLAAKNLTRITAESISEGRMDYVAFCGVLEDVNVLGEEHRVDAKEFLWSQQQQTRQRQWSGQRDGGHIGKRKRGFKSRPRGLVVDVREEHEVELGPKISGSVNVPLSRILRHGGKAFDDLHAHIDRVHVEDAGPDGTAREGFGEGRQGGMIDQETHVPVAISGSTITAHSGAASENVSFGGMVDEETHISPTSRAQDFPVEHSKPGQVSGINSGLNLENGALVNEESHVPITATDRDAYPQRPDAKNQDSHDERSGNTDIFAPEEEERTGDEENGWPIYFVCQRGNDSQIAAQKLLDRIRAEEKEEADMEVEAPGDLDGSAPVARKKTRPWGWVGDIKGGFVALERHHFEGSP